jgi:hypothetical protein
MRNPRAHRHARTRPTTSGRDIRTVYAERLRSPDRQDRLRALDELEYLNCDRSLSRETKLAVVGWCLDDYHLKPVAERRAIGRFLDAWLDSQPERLLARRLAAARMEEVDHETRDSLLPASFAVLPTDELIAQVATPDAELLRDGYGLLVALDALHMRLHNADLAPSVLDDAIAALRRARSIRNTPVVKPFLWQVEVVLELACARRGVAVPGGLRE